MREVETVQPLAPPPNLDRKSHTTGPACWPPSRLVTAHRRGLAHQLVSTHTPVGSGTGLHGLARPSKGGGGLLAGSEFSDGYRAPEEVSLG